MTLPGGRAHRSARRLAPVALALLLAAARRRLRHAAAAMPTTTGAVAAPAPRAAIRARRCRPGASATAPIRAIPMAAINYAQALRGMGQRAQAVAVLRAGLDPQSREHGTARRLWPRARRCRQARAGAARCSTAPTRRIGRTGASSTCRAPCSTSSAGTRRRRATTRPRCGSRRRSRRCCPISGCPTRCRRICREAEATLQARVHRPQHRSARAAESGAGGRIAGPLPRSGSDRARRPAARTGRRQCRLSAADARAAQCAAGARPAHASAGAAGRADSRPDWRADGS